MPIYPVVRSLLSASALRDTVADGYNLGPVDVCRLLARGLNDTYRIEAGTEQYALRVSRAHWRSNSDVLYELALLLHLREQGVAVPAPVACRDGSLLFTVSAPEGPRQATLFTWVPGRPADMSEALALALGGALAATHNAADTLRTDHQRFVLDLRHLIREPLRLAAPFFAHRSDDWDYLVRLGETISERVQALAALGLDLGSVSR